MRNEGEGEKAREGEENVVQWVLFGCVAAV